MLNCEIFLKVEFKLGMSLENFGLVNYLLFKSQSERERGYMNEEGGIKIQTNNPKVRPI
jgi:hypothetical protein